MKVAVFGAAGETGSRVARRLRTRGINPKLLGRRSGPLRALAAQLRGAPWAAASTEDPNSLVQGLGDCSAVINCAGPFCDTGRVVIEAAMRVGADYIDVSGEADFHTWIWREFGASQGRPGPRICPGVAAIGAGLGEALALLTIDRLSGTGPVETLDVGYAFDPWMQSSASTKSLHALVAGSCAGWENGAWTRIRPGAQTRIMRYPPPFGSGVSANFPFCEPSNLPRLIRVHRVRSFISLSPHRPWGGAITRAAAKAFSFNPQLIPGLLGSLVAPWHQYARFMNEVDLFSVVACADRSGDAMGLGLVAAHPYDVTADMAVEVALSLRKLFGQRTGLISAGLILKRLLGQPAWAKRGIALWQMN